MVTPPRSSLISALEEITGIAQNLKHYVRERQCVPTLGQLSSPIPTPIPPLILPYPDDLMASLHALGLPPHMLEASSSKVSHAIREIQDVHTNNYNKTCQQLRLAPPGHRPLSQIFHELRRAYQDSYSKQCLPWIHSQIRTAWAARVDKSKQRNEREGRRAFNSEYTPLLETYFQYNAYPSAPDRQILARKTMMKPRQIEVWFQNHRNRAKKEGKTLRKLVNPPLSFDISLEALEKKMPLFTIRKEDRLEHERAQSDGLSDDKSDNENQLVPTLSSSGDLLDIPAPEHAFPMTYPPRVGYQPFPMADGRLSFPPPIWARRPISARPETAPVDFDDFVASFAAKLNLREDLSKRKPTHTPLGKLTRSWFTNTVTIPSPAPHPALVRTSTSHLNAIVSSGLCPGGPQPSQHGTLVTGRADHRRSFPISRQAPKNSFNAQLGVSPQFYRPTTFPSSSPSSRKSSSSSASSSVRSSSPSSSSTGSNLNTPTSSPTTLDNTINLPILTNLPMGFPNAKLVAFPDYQMAACTPLMDSAFKDPFLPDYALAYS